MKLEMSSCVEMEFDRRVDDLKKLGVRLEGESNRQNLILAVTCFGGFKSLSRSVFIPLSLCPLTHLVSALVKHGTKSAANFLARSLLLITIQVKVG